MKTPDFIEPQLATLVGEVPGEDADWLYELKFDGYRLLCRLDQGHARLLTRAGNDWTRQFPEFVAALEALPVSSAVLDGEAVVLDARGRSSFQSLQRIIGQPQSRERSHLALFLFDLLFLDGRDLRKEPLLERKKALRELLGNGSSRLRYSDHVQGHGREFFANACATGVEGIVAKRADASYQSGRTRSWLKIKCLHRQEFVIVGFSDPQASRVGLGALLLGAHDEKGVLRYTGKVGTGFTGKTLLDLRARLSPLEQDQPAVGNPPPRRGVHWVIPKLVAEVSFSEWTGDGRIRHPSFVGLREDKPAGEVRIEKEADRRIGGQADENKADRRIGGWADDTPFYPPVRPSA